MQINHESTKSIMKVPGSRANWASGNKNNVYYVAAPLGGIFASLQQAAGNWTLKKIARVSLCGACRVDLSRRSFNEDGSLVRRRVCGQQKTATTKGAKNYR